MDGAQQEQLRKNYSEDLDIIILKVIRIMLETDCENPYVNTFKTASQIYKKNPEAELRISIVTDKNADKRTYNIPTATEIAILIPSMGEASEPTERNGFIFYKNGTLKNIIRDVIEFQKRGLPHAHILIIMEVDSKPRCSEDYDRIVSAEIPDKLKHPQAWKTVTTSMIHGPCGKYNPNSPCMVDGKSKKYK